MKQILYILLFITIILIATIGRANQLFNASNYYFQQEQGTEYLVTKQIVIDHQIVLTAHQGGLGTFQKPAGFNYILTIPFIIADGNPFAGRIMMFLFSALTVVFAFILINKMFGIKYAFVISMLLAISPNLKDYTGGISPPFIIPFLTIFFIYFTYKVFHNDQRYIPILVFLVGFMANFETAVSVSLICYLLLTFVVCYFKKIRFKRIYLLLSALLYFLNYLPLFLYDLSHNFYNIKGILSIFNIGKEHFSQQSNSTLFEMIKNKLEVFSWNYISTFSPQPIIYILVSVILALGIYFILNKKKFKDRLFFRYLALLPIFTFVMFLFYPGNQINQWWIINLTVIYCFLLGFIIIELFSNLFNKILISTLILLLFLGFINRTNYIYKTQFAFPPSAYIQEEQPIKYIFENEHVKNFNIFVISKQSQQNYEYLIWWYGKKFGYQPQIIAKNTYFAIIEPNYIYPTSDTPGALLKSIKLANGFIIEERENN